MAGEWLECALGDIIELKRGYDLPQQDRHPGLVPLVSSSGVTDYHSAAMVKGPGVVTGRYGTLGQVFYVDEDFWPLNTTLYVRDFKGNDPRFVSYFLRGLDFLAYSDKAAVPGLNRNHLHQADVRIPSDVREQRAIAQILGALDDKIELNRRMNETLEGMARALFKSWFADFDPVRAKSAGITPPGLDPATAALFPARFQASELGEIPVGWRVGSLLENARLLSGGTPKTNREEYWNGDVPWASAKDVSQCGQTFLVATERTITRKGLEGSATQLIPPLSTVVVARGATTGRMALLGRAMAMNQTCYALTSTDDTPFALYGLVRHEIDALVRSAHGSVFDTITTTTFARSRTILAPREVRAEFDREMTLLFHRMLGNIEGARSLTAVRDALLPKLLSGEIRVKDAEKFVEART